MTRSHIGRWLYTGEGAVPGYLVLESGRVAEVCLGEAPAGSSRSVVLPGFVNAHTHLGDSIAYPAPPGTVEETVGPPDGYKHKVLKATSSEAKVQAMRASVQLMAATGTSLFADFREEGVEGVKMLKAALGPGAPKTIVLGRPAGVGYIDREVAAILSASDGLGVSAARDWPEDTLKRMCSIVKRSGKLLGIHASEAVREDIGRVLSCGPDFVVHMTSASSDDLRRCAERRVPVVVCPRSNEFFGLRPDIPAMLKAGLVVALGTDNCMICRPDMLAELQAAHRLSLPRGGLTPVQAIHLATDAGRKVLNAEPKITTEISETGDLVAVDVRGEDPLDEVVTVSRSEDISAVIQGGELRRQGNWRT